MAFFHLIIIKYNIIAIVITAFNEITPDADPRNIEE